jgi:hypothetical protein
MVRRVRVLAFAVLLLVLPLAIADTQPRGTASITSPTEEFGAAIGDDYFLATWRQFERYWKKLDAESNRMTLVDLGKTEEGRSQWMAIITAPENFARLNRYRRSHVVSPALKALPSRTLGRLHRKAAPSSGSTEGCMPTRCWVRSN